MEIRDKCTDMLGIECLKLGDESAILRMKITGNMLNVHNTCHGGMIFTLADAAFAFACNTNASVAVAQGASIDYVEPAHEGDVLVATARSRVQTRRTGIYDVEVRNNQDKLVALFTGKSVSLTRAPGLSGK